MIFVPFATLTKEGAQWQPPVQLALILTLPASATPGMRTNIAPTKPTDSKRPAHLEAIPTPPSSDREPTKPEGITTLIRILEPNGLPSAAPRKGGHQGDFGALVNFVPYVALESVDQDREDEAAWRAQCIHHLGHAAAIRHLELGTAPAVREVLAHGTECSNRYLHRPIFPRRVAALAYVRKVGSSMQLFQRRRVSRSFYFSILTPTRLPYSVHEPS
jgi:hypothetical protein